MRSREIFVYILASRTHRLYVGVTNDLQRRLWEHQHGPRFGFTRRYGIHTLVYFEPSQEPMAAIAREKRIKGWTRVKKLALIEAYNPTWTDLGRSLGLTPPGEPVLRCAQDHCQA